MYILQLIQNLNTNTITNNVSIEHDKFFETAVIWKGGSHSDVFLGINKLFPSIPPSTRLLVWPTGLGALCLSLLLLLFLFSFSFLDGYIGY